MKSSKIKGAGYGNLLPTSDLSTLTHTIQAKKIKKNDYPNEKTQSKSNLHAERFLPFAYQIRQRGEIWAKSVVLTQQVKGVGKHRRKHLNCPLAEGYPIDMAACEFSCRKEILMTSAALYGSRKRQFRPKISCGRVYCRFSLAFTHPKKKQLTGY